MLAIAFTLLALLFTGCQGYQIELDPNWKAESQPDPTDMSDTAGDVLSEICSTFDCSLEPFCNNSDAIAWECCGGCVEGEARCFPYVDPNFHQEIFTCKNGCWDYDAQCEHGSYCSTVTPDGPVCDALPLESDSFCDPEFAWADPDCQTCPKCTVPFEAHCVPSMMGSDYLVRCNDFTGFGHFCWEEETCNSFDFGSRCVEDFAQNHAACVTNESSDDFCDQFICTGARLCNFHDGPPTDTSNECGFCGKCCEDDYENLCGYMSNSSMEPARLFLNEDESCFEAMPCNNWEDNDWDDFGYNYCRFDSFDVPHCEDADFEH